MKKATKNYILDVTMFMPFVLLLASGIVMLKYHTGADYTSEAMGLDGHRWLSIHKNLMVISLPLIIFHLIFHFQWLKDLFTLRLKNKHRGVNIALFVIFLITAITAILSASVFAGTETSMLLRGIHNKFGLLLIAFFIIHFKNYFKWILNKTKNLLAK